MTPHRAQNVAGYALANVRSLYQVPVDFAGAAITAAGASAAWLIGPSNVTLLYLVGSAMLLDLVVGALRAVDDPLQSFSVAKLYGGFVGKLFRFCLIPTGALVDRLIRETGFIDAGDFPTTKLIMFGLAAAELTSVLAKFRDGGVAPALIAEVTRHLDRLRIGTEPPVQRHYDPPAIASEIEREAQADSDTHN